jgi:hypothetical protein
MIGSSPARLQARAALGAANQVLKKLDVTMNPQKTRIVHVRRGVLGTRSREVAGRCA